EVKQGDVVLELDPTDPAADRATIYRDLEGMRAQNARRSAAVEATKAGRFDDTPEILFEPDINATVRAREESVLAADFAKLRAALATLGSRIAENVAQQRALQLTMASHQAAVASLERKVKMYQTLV